MRARSLVTVAGLLCAAARGARSTLLDGAGSPPGSGGTGSGTSAAAVTTGPGGGPSVVCKALVSPEPRIELPAYDPLVAARDPLLLLLDQGDVLTLVRGDAPKAPVLAPVTISAIRLDPWSIWPPEPPSGR